MRYASVIKLLNKCLSFCSNFRQCPSLIGYLEGFPVLFAPPIFKALIASRVLLALGIVIFSTRFFQDQTNTRPE